jgi:hypothetical protein
MERQSAHLVSAALALDHAVPLLSSATITYNRVHSLHVRATVPIPPLRHAVRPAVLLLVTSHTIKLGTLVVDHATRSALVN